MFEAFLKQRYWYQTILVIQIYGQLEVNSRYKQKFEGQVYLEETQLQNPNLWINVKIFKCSPWLLEEEWDHRITEWLR